MIALAVPGMIVARVWYYMVDLPIQQVAVLHVPGNFNPGNVR